MKRPPPDFELQEKLGDVLARIAPIHSSQVAPELLPMFARSWGPEPEFDQPLERVR